MKEAQTRMRASWAFLILCDVDFICVDRAANRMGHQRWKYSCIRSLKHAFYRIAPEYHETRETSLWNERDHRKAKISLALIAHSTVALKGEHAHSYREEEENLKPYVYKLWNPLDGELAQFLIQNGPRVPIGRVMEYIADPEPKWKQ